VKKTVVALVLIAVLVGAVAVYVLVGDQSMSNRVIGSFSVDSAGATVATSDGKATLVVPAGALLNKTDITVASVQNVAVPNCTVISTYQFGPEGTYFLTPAIVKVTYNPAALPSDLNQSHLGLFTEVAAGFGQVASSSVDTVNHVVSGQVSHFSMLCVAASKAQPEPSGPAIVGKWDRLDGADKYTFSSDRSTETLLGGDVHHGGWVQDGKNASNFVLSWDFGPTSGRTFVDYVTVASDGQSYVGLNNYGASINCVRVSGDKPPTAVITSSPQPYKVERKITVNSESFDPDDSSKMLKCVWTVASPKGKAVDITQIQQGATFTPHEVGDYLVTLTVSDGLWKDTTSITLTVVPNIKLEMLEADSDITNNLVTVQFSVANYGTEIVNVKPYVVLAGMRGGKLFELGPYELAFSGYDLNNPSKSSSFVLFPSQGDMEVGGPIQLPSSGTTSYFVTAVPYNAVLTVGSQMTYLSDSKWAATLTLGEDKGFATWGPVS
jgi:hypothetical protein